ncbi:MAG: nicotinamide mononucleotide transporter [Clostridia bacterium]|nr:nicotinamide mononucleotide transporter [Clostridia bacterium]
MKPTFKENVKKIFTIRFTTYEKIWVLSLTALAIVMAFLFPEEDVSFFDANGNVTFVSSGVVITILYVFDVIIGNFCELLFSKQLRWAFLLYNVVELIEIAALILTGSRFASMATAIFYWIPAHTMGFFVWRRHKDRVDDKKTVVRKLKWWQTVLIFAVTIGFTFGVGYLIADMTPPSDFYGSETLWKVIAYLDASLAIMSIIDGILMYFRSKESWWTWYLYIAIETVVNILSGQWILLVYKLGYLTNTTYGLIKWSRYIKENEISKE